MKIPIRKKTIYKSGEIFTMIKEDLKVKEKVYVSIYDTF